MIRLRRFAIILVICSSLGIMAISQILPHAPEVTTSLPLEYRHSEIGYNEYFYLVVGDDNPVKDAAIDLLKSKKFTYSTNLDDLNSNSVVIFTSANIADYLDLKTVASLANYVLFAGGIGANSENSYLNNILGINQKHELVRLDYLTFEGKKVALSDFYNTALVDLRESTQVILEGSNPIIFKNNNFAVINSSLALSSGFILLGLENLVPDLIYPITATTNILIGNIPVNFSSIDVILEYRTNDFIQEVFLPSIKAIALLDNLNYNIGLLKYSGSFTAADIPLFNSITGDDFLDFIYEGDFSGAFVESDLNLNTDYINCLYGSSNQSAYQDISIDYHQFSDFKDLEIINNQLLNREFLLRIDTIEFISDYEANLEKLTNMLSNITSPSSSVGQYLNINEAYQKVEYTSNHQGNELIVKIDNESGQSFFLKTESQISVTNGDFQKVPGGYIISVNDVEVIIKIGEER